MPRFLLYFYLRREAKAGFDKQGWILFLGFISIGVTLGDKKKVSVRRQNWAASPKGSKRPGKPSGTTRERLLRQGIGILTAPEVGQKLLLVLDV